MSRLRKLTTFQNIDGDFEISVAPTDEGVSLKIVVLGETYISLDYDDAYDLIEALHDALA